MYQVIDTIIFQNSWTHRYPEFAKRGEGVMVILEPGQINQRPQIEGRSVTIHKPDGSTSKLVAARAEVHHSVVGVFFSSASAEDIPRGSRLEW